MPPLASSRHIRAEQRRYRRAQSGTAWSVKDLPQFYYQKNFNGLLESIEARFSHLLDHHDAGFIHDFRDLPFPAQCAYVRLCSRKGTQK